MIQTGLSCRMVMTKTGISKSSVSRIRRTLQEVPFISKGGRPKKLNPRDVRTCVRAICNGAKSAKSIAQQLRTDFDIICTAQTVRRALLSEGFQAKKKIKKPAISEKNRKARLAFAKSHKDWTIYDWHRIVFSDETKINRLCSDGITWCWVPKNSGLTSARISPTVKGGGGSIMMWGCITHKGPGLACQIEGKMDQNLYRSILEDELFQTLDLYDLKQSKTIFMQDNDPKHRAKSVMKWLAEQDFSILDWPAQSPDLNPIENLWRQVKLMLSRFDSPPIGLAELWDRTASVFSQITASECVSLYETMPSRMAAVIKAKGRWTKF